MPALKRTEHVGVVRWLGRVPDRRTPRITTLAVEAMELTFAGLAEGEVHAGLTRPACVRFRTLYPEGTEIRNTRQVSLVSVEEMAEIAARLGLERLDPAWLGASVVLEGLPDVSHMPPSSRLQDEDSGATLTVDMQNRPCRFPAASIEAAHPGHGAGFVAAARGRRGVTACVEREGRIALGARLRLHVPDQRRWRP